MTSPSPKVYSLSEFSEEEKAVAMAKCSRSTNTFMADALAVRAAGNADGFHERVVVGYGHGSVADMSMGSLCFEDVSILAAEHLVDLQTGKYQGKSSRYVPFSRERVIQPFDKDKDTKNYLQYNKAINALFDAYEGLHAPLTEWVSQQPNMAEATQAQVRARVFDNLRYLLPLGALTNIGTRLSSRDTAELIRRLKAEDLQEFSEIAGLIKEAASAETPTMVRHTEDYGGHRMVKNILQFIPEGDNTRYTETKAVTLRNTVGSPAEIGKMLIFQETGIFKFSRVDSARALSNLDDYMLTRDRRQDPVPQAFRQVRYEFNIEADFGTWKDLRRHRRQEQFRFKHFRADLGYEIPEDIQAMGSQCLETYTDAMDEATRVWRFLEVQSLEAEAQYIIAHGHKQAWIIDMDLEQLYYVVELRTQPGGHISYRRIAAKMLELAREKHPELFTHILAHPVEGIEIHK